jgi:hypothetical protein
MSRISFLDKSNFVILGTRQKSLGINLQGNFLVFFKMAGDPNCAEFEPIFAKLSQTEKRVSHAILDVSQYKEIVIWSRETSTPITGVPLLILYVEGRPHAKFNGTKNVTSIQTFITKALGAGAQSQPNKQFMPSNNMYGAGGSSPGYSAPGGMNHQQGNAWEPDIGKAPSMKGIIKGYSKGGYATGNNVEEEDEMKLKIPDSVIPWNTPWEAEFQEN